MAIFEIFSRLCSPNQVMAKSSLLSLLLCVVLSLTWTSTHAKKGMDQRIWESLRRTSEQGFFPPKFGIQLETTFTITTLSNFDPITSSLDIGYWISMKWNDPTLKWDTKKFNQSQIRVPSAMVWTPDIVPYVSQNNKKLFDSYVVVVSDGSVTYVPSYQVRVVCKDMNKDDRKECSVKFGSWVHDGSSLNITSTRVDEDFVKLTALENSGFSYIKSDVKMQTVFYACCKEPYQSVTLTVTIQKKADSEKEEKLLATANKGTDQLIWESLRRTQGQGNYFPQKNIQLGLIFMVASLSNFDPKTSSLLMNYWMSMDWKESAIKWNAKKFNQSVIRVPSALVWTPDIVPFRSAYKKMFDSYAVLSADGKIKYVPSQQSRIVCSNAKRNDDRKECLAKFGSWSYDSNLLNITSCEINNDYITFDGLENSGWSYVETTIKPESKKYKCCKEIYQSVTLKVTIQKKAGTRKREE